MAGSDVHLPGSPENKPLEEKGRTLNTPQNLPPKPKLKPANGPKAVDWLPHREKAFWLYSTKAVQWGVAFVILFNFVAIVIEKEIDPYEPEYQQYHPTWQAIDDVCNVIFLIELLLNLYASFWRPFIIEPWNYLDTVVVIIGVLSLARVPLGSFRQIKVIRAFRIIRLFKRIKSLNKILVALLKSIPGVLNAFVVMLIFMMIFAILAVDFFRDFGGSGEYTTVQTYGGEDATWGAGEGMTSSTPYEFFDQESKVTAITARGFHYGQEYFGTFFRSLYTLFQVLTGESWSEAVVRPLIFGLDPDNAFGVGLFFTFYILVSAVVLQNVVVAVLLDKFVTDGDDDEEEDKADAADELGSRSAADEAVLRDAAKLGLQTSPVVRAPTPPGSSEAIDAVRTRMDKLLDEQRLIKTQLHLVLSRLPKNGARPPIDNDPALGA